MPQAWYDVEIYYILGLLGSWSHCKAILNERLYVWLHIEWNKEIVWYLATVLVVVMGYVSPSPAAWARAG